MNKQLSNHEIKNIIEKYKEKLIKLSEKTYSKYSHFRVASILITEKNEYYGVNIENRSFGLTICAERVAVFEAVKNQDFNFKYIFVYSPDALSPLPPCGACRQVISEFSNDVIVIMLSKDFDYKAAYINEIYPFDSLHNLN